MTLLACPLRRALCRAGAFLLLAVPLGCGQANPPAAETIPPAPVKWENARRFNLSEWTELVGTIQPLPDRIARITAPVEGRVLTVLQGANGQRVVEGQPIHKGEVIAHLDDTIVRKARDEEKDHHEIAKLDIDQAKLAVKRATIELESQQKQKASGTYSPVALQIAEVALDEAQSKQRAAEQKLKASDNHLASLEEQLRLYTLTAPIDGRLGRMQVVPGQTLAVGTLVTDVVDVREQIDVLCFVSSRVAQQLQLGQKAQVGGLDKEYVGAASGIEGEVVFLAEQAEPDTGNYAVKVRFPNKEGKLPVNAVLQIRVQTKPEKECFAIPEAALMEDQDPPVVVVAEEKTNDKGQPVMDDKGEPVMVARRVAVKVGIRDRVLHQVEILGFEDPKWHGDVESVLFITEKGQGLQTGDVVKLQVDEDD